MDIQYRKSCQTIGNYLEELVAAVYKLFLSDIAIYLLFVLHGIVYVLVTLAQFLMVSFTSPDKAIKYRYRSFLEATFNIFKDCLKYPSKSEAETRPSSVQHFAKHSDNACNW